jgi:NAD(P)-dependent dehydrogenase (short-subunit alcohol dehydrogenase family)
LSKPPHAINNARERHFDPWEDFMNLFDLTGKVALVTGSTKGIGEAIVHRLAEHGAKVVVSSRKADACEKVAADINKERGKEVAVPIPCNINYKEQLEQLVAQTRAKWAKIDILVCNAALNPYYGSSMDIPDDAFDKIMGANIRSNHWLSQLVIPEMKERKDGSIIIVSSIGGLRGSPVIGAYCISKAADMQLARNIAVEYGPHNIRANCIAPGLIKTDFAKALWENPETLKRSTAGAPLRRIGEPDEIAGAAVFLASKAGSFTTGQVIVCDGGATI